MSSRTTATRLRRGGAILTALLLSVLVVSTSGAVFSGAASTGGYEVTASDVEITATQAGSASLAVTDVVPNDRITRCFTIAYTGTAVGDDLEAVRLYANADYDDADNLSSVLNLTIEQDDAFTGLTDPVDEACVNATPSSLPIYSGTVENFTDNATTPHVDYGTGIDTAWTPAATSETRGYRIIIEFDGAAGNAFENAQLGTPTTPLTFTWEVQSTSTGSEK